MAKKRKSRFRIRYLLVLLLIYFLYRILVVSLPVGKAHISYSGKVPERKKNEVGRIVKKTGVDDLNELKDSLESLPWVESVGLSRSILSRLKIVVVPRVPMLRMASGVGKVIDNNGFIFNYDNVDSLPMVKISEGISSKEIAQALGILGILREFEIDKVVINHDGVRTWISNVEILWGNDEFLRKKEIFKSILRNNISEFKGKLDFRFKNMVVLRR